MPLGTVFVVAGVIFEFKTICKEWKYVLYNSLASFILSFFGFFPGKYEKIYDLDKHILVWPYWFCSFFVLFAITIYHEKIIRKLTEGITLLQSLAIIYWLYDAGWFTHSSNFVRTISFAALAYSIISIILAFSYLELSRRMRFSLSFWSSIVMAVFAVDNIYSVYNSPPIEFSKEFYEGAFVAVQYFMLGISAVYIAQNITMVLGFLPGKNTMFNEAYFQDVRALKKDHIDRYSTEQIKQSHAVLCILLSTGIYFLNYQLKLFPRQFVIWILFITFPLLIHLITKRNE